MFETVPCIDITLEWMLPHVRQYLNNTRKIHNLWKKTIYLVLKGKDNISVIATAIEEEC